MIMLMMRSYHPARWDYDDDCYSFLALVLCLRLGRRFGTAGVDQTWRECLLSV